jgi:hypothetical protein
LIAKAPEFPGRFGIGPTEIDTDELGGGDSEDRTGCSPTSLRTGLCHSTTNGFGAETKRVFALFLRPGRAQRPMIDRESLAISGVVLRVCHRVDWLSTVNVVWPNSPFSASRKIYSQSLVGSRIKHFDQQRLRNDACAFGSGMRIQHVHIARMENGNLRY